MKIIKLSLSFFLLLVFQGCEPQYVDIDIQRDGNISYVYPSDVSDKIKNSYELTVPFNLIQKTHKYRITDNYVDNSVYNFLIVVPLKSKTDIQATLKKYHDESDEIESIPFYFAGLYTSSVTQKGIDNYYHYKLYLASNWSAAWYQLNDIKDYIFQLSHTYTGYPYAIYITTNEVTIQAKELEELLESLAISHDRLDFQPEGY